MKAENWIRWALYLSWFTIVYNFIEGIVSIYFGVKDDSISLAGFGGDSLIEVGSAFMVLWRFHGEVGKMAQESKEEAERRERRAIFGIGILFLLLFGVTVSGGVLHLLGNQHPVTTVPGVLLSTLSLSFMFYLWSKKKKVGLALGSKTVLKDAACSLACIQLSFVLFLGSLSYWLFPSLWWVDAVAALILSGFFLREGWSVFSRTPCCEKV